MGIGIKKTKWKEQSIIPGFGITFGFTTLYVSLLVLIPLSTIFINSSTLGWSHFWKVATEPRAIASYRVTFEASAVAALINGIFGFILAWILVRYEFYGKKIVDGLVDLPFALPTAVAGITLTTLYAKEGWIGRYFQFFGIKVSYTFWGIVVALIFIGIPFVVRTVQPVLEGIEGEYEEAAASLGASPSVIFLRVVFPEVFPALLTGVSLAFARAIGEYGSVVFIAGNMPFKTEIAPFIIITKLEQYDYTGATSIAVVILILSFVMLFVINGIQWLNQRKYRLR